jgi:pimeloyl-ACP methyl ester carboxylesterase
MVMLALHPAEADFITVSGIRQELVTAGQGQPILFLHPALGLAGAETCLDLLARSGRVIAPSHPGFGRSDLPAWMNRVDDLAYFYLDLMDQLDLRDVVLVGASFGGWIAAEIAVKSTARLSRVVLAGAVGIKVGGREQRDIADIYALPRAELDRRMYSDPARMPDAASLSDEQLCLLARNREAEALFGWSPYMHDPKLTRRLHRIDVPTLVLWGAADGIVSPDYGRAFAAAIPGASFELIEGAAHLPHIEQPAAFAERAAAFMAGANPRTDRSRN